MLLVPVNNESSNGLCFFLFFVSHKLPTNAPYLCFQHVKEKAQKIECTCAVDTYVAKSKLPIELNILISYIQMALKLVKNREKKN